MAFPVAACFFWCVDFTSMALCTHNQHNALVVCYDFTVASCCYLNTCVSKIYTYNQLINHLFIYSTNLYYLLYSCLICVLEKSYPEKYSYDSMHWSTKMWGGISPTTFAYVRQFRYLSCFHSLPASMDLNQLDQGCSWSSLSREPRCPTGHSRRIWWLICTYYCYDEWISR